MALAFYYHPFSSYCWKALIPLYEAGTAFTPRRVDDPETGAELKRRWPIGRFPMLVEETTGLTLPEASIIIEYLDTLPVTRGDRTLLGTRQPALVAKALSTISIVN